MTRRQALARRNQIRETVCYLAAINAFIICLIMLMAVLVDLTS